MYRSTAVAVQIYNTTICEICIIRSARSVQSDVFNFSKISRPHDPLQAPVQIAIAQQHHRERLWRLAFLQRGSSCTRACAMLCCLVRARRAHHMWQQAPILSQVFSNWFRFRTRTTCSPLSPYTIQKGFVVIQLTSSTNGKTRALHERYTFAHAIYAAYPQDRRPLRHQQHPRGRLCMNLVVICWICLQLWCALALFYTCVCVFCVLENIPACLSACRCCAFWCLDFVCATAVLSSDTSPGLLA